MRTKLLYIGLFIAVCLGLSGCATCHKSCGTAGCGKSALGKKEELLKFQATVDGSGRFIFTTDTVSYEHKNWDPPSNVSLNGEPWKDLNQTPSGWTDLSRELDLCHAHITERTGRDVIALEPTEKGFDLYLGDTPGGADDYSATIAIPYR